MSVTLHTGLVGDIISLEKLDRLLKAAYGQPILGPNLEHGRWELMDNPEGAAVFTVAQDQRSGEYASCGGIIPMSYQFGADAARFGSIVKTSSDPAYAGQGLFKRTFQRMLEDAPAHGFKQLFGFANDQAFPIYQRLGIDKIGDYVPHVRVVAMPVSAARALETDVDGLLAIEQDPRFVQRAVTRELLTWRLLDQPGQQHRLLEIRGAGYQGAVAYRLRRRLGLRFAEISLLRLPSWHPEPVREMLAAIAADAGCRVLSLRLHTPSIASDVLREAGCFLRDGERLRTGNIGIDFAPVAPLQLHARSWSRLQDGLDADW